MNTELSASLPWDELNRQHEEIPWPVLRTFADALVTDRELVPRLIEFYDQAYEKVADQTGCPDLYAMGIFALAAPHLNDERRREIGSILIDRLAGAGQDDATLSMEVVSAAAGTMGPVILPAALEAIANEPDTQGAWAYLWSLTTLAEKTEDEGLRSQVVRACADLLDRIDHGQVAPEDGTQAAWTLAALKRTEYTDLIRRLSMKSELLFCQGDYEDALKLMQEQLDYSPAPELWEEPVETWLTPRCKEIPEYRDEPDDYEQEEELEIELDPDMQRAALMASSFCASPVAAGLPQELRGRAHSIVKTLLYNSFVELGLAPASWDESALRELLLDIMPRKLPPVGKMLESLVPITESLLYWFHFRGYVVDADALADTIHGWTDQVVAAGANGKNWGIDKRYVVEALEAGLDPADPQTKWDFLRRRVSESLDALAALTPQKEETEIEIQRKKETETGQEQEHKPPIPIVEHRQKIARNAPCPCGSGRKYKKCCGRSETAAAAD